MSNRRPSVTSSRGISVDLPKQKQQIDIRSEKAKTDYIDYSLMKLEETHTHTHTHTLTLTYIFFCDTITAFLCDMHSIFYFLPYNFF